MSINERSLTRLNGGVGLIEVMISIIIAMLLVLVIYQVYEISEGQKRTITAGSDAQQNASYGLYVLGRDLAMAGNGIASTASALQKCNLDNLPLPPGLVAPHPFKSLRPIPVVIEHFPEADKPDKITLFYGGSISLSTPVPFQQPEPATTDDPYKVRAPVGFSAKDVIAAVWDTNCTLSTVNSVDVDAGGYATLRHTPVAGNIGAVSYPAGQASLINLGQTSSMARITYSVDLTTNALRTQSQFSKEMAATMDPVPVVSDVVNLKAQYGVDTSVPPDGVMDAWQDAIDDWTPEALAALAPAAMLDKVRRILAVRVAIVTRSAQYEKDLVTAVPLVMFADTAPKPGDDCSKFPAPAVCVDLSEPQQHYRYKVLETIVPLRNALWNGS